MRECKILIKNLLQLFSKECHFNTLPSWPQTRSTFRFRLLKNTLSKNEKKADFSTSTKVETKPQV